MARNTQEFGQVELVRHPLVVVRGLPRAQVGELVHFSSGAYGQVFSLNSDSLDVLVFAAESLQVGETVTRFGHPLTITLAKSLTGKLLVPLQVITQASSTGRSVDAPPQALQTRRRITQSLTTGISIVDIVLPLGKGQRQLLVGDRKSGKTTFAIQLSAAQVQAGAVIVYAVIGKLHSEIKKIQAAFQTKGIADSVTLVASAADDPPSVIYQTPFIAMAIAEYLQAMGIDVVVIFDDLTTHAKYYREIALIGKRFPGRDSYPGDMYYTHARLLERGGCFAHQDHPETGVSITCLPIAESADADLTDFIVSNLISMTDGHLLFDSMIYAQGHRPAIHPGLSVTRVGKQTQTTLQRELTHKVTSFINQYQKTMSLTHFGAELTGAAKTVLSRGDVLFAFLGQTKDADYAPNVLSIICAAVMLDWFSQSVTAEVVQARDTLQVRYSTEPAIRSQIDELLSQNKTLVELSAVLTNTRPSITQLWQPLKQ
jgi:F-type H+-transporting ATPase subunit alpha